MNRKVYLTHPIPLNTAGHAHKHIQKRQLSKMVRTQKKPRMPPYCRPMPRVVRTTAGPEEVFFLVSAARSSLRHKPAATPQPESHGHTHLR